MEKTNKSFLDEAKNTVKSLESSEDLIKRLIDQFDGLNKAENIIFKNLYDLIFLYFPESIDKLGDKDNFINTLGKCKVFSRREIAELIEIDNKSMGYDLDEESIGIIKNTLDLINLMGKLKEDVKEELNKLLKVSCPNLLAVTDTLLAARLIRLSGSEKDLASIPSSKIQVLGAESSMFLSKRKPKYGVIYNHRLMINAKDPGKVAKLISSYISLAAKMDVFSKRFDGDSLVNKLEERVRRING